MNFDESAVRRRLDALAKPPGSMGRLEDLAARLVATQHPLDLQTRPRRAVLFAADHGVVDAGVTVWPREVTSLVASTVLAGRGVSSVLALASQTQLAVVDVGLAKPLPAAAIRATDPSWSDVWFVAKRVRAGTRNLAVEPALSPGEFRAAFDVGRATAEEAARDWVRVAIGGEIGIGNTTAAACLAALLADVPLDSAVGRGAGADDATLARKRAVVAAAVNRERPRLAADPVAAIAGVCGLEIAALAGFYAKCAEDALTVVLDGYISAAAALVAERLAPGTARRMIASHLSAEPGHAATLARLGLVPFLDGWNMRLGEGSGALTFVPLLDAAAALYRDAALLADVLPPPTLDDGPPNPRPIP